MIQDASRLRNYININFTEDPLLTLNKTVFCLGHISIDIIIHRSVFDQLRIGGCIESQDLSIRGGGDTANVAFWLGKLGIPVSMIGVIADDPAGLFLLNDLKRANVDLKLKFTKKYPSASILIIVEPDGERSFIINGQSQNDLEWTDLPIKEISKSDFFYTSAYTIENDPVKSTIFQLFQHLKANYSTKTKLMFNLASYTTVEKQKKEIKTKILPYTDILVGNKEEVYVLKNKSKDDPLQISRDLTEEYQNLAVVLITDGANGCYYYTRRERGHIKAPRISVIDTTGAGDGFCAGFISKYISEDTIENSIKYGIELGSEICQGYGARYEQRTN